MSELPFGFGGPEREPGKPTDPFAALFGGASGGPGDLSAALHRFADLLAWTGGPVNWDLARDLACRAAAAEGDPTPAPAEAAAITEAVRLADLWLDPVTMLPSGVAAAEAWTRAQWVERTVPVWSQLTDPVAAHVVEAMTAALPPEAAALAGPLGGVLKQVGGMMFGGQVGQAVGELAREVVSSTDIGLPLGPAGHAALLPANVARFGAGLQVPSDEVRLYVALREAAHHRLFGHVPWLRAHLLGAVDAYARGMRVDVSALEEAMRDLDPTNPQALQEALAGGLFEPRTTPEQQAALTRLETALALVEGWVDTVVTTAAQSLPSAAALRETVRRRRATGGPAEQTFGTLVGLELRPRRLRDAAQLWRALADARGVSGRDTVWNHPDLLPGTDDLDDPQGFVDRSD